MFSPLPTPAKGAGKQAFLCKNSGIVSEHMLHEVGEQKVEEQHHQKTKSGMMPKSGAHLWEHRRPPRPLQKGPGLYVRGSFRVLELFHFVEPTRRAVTWWTRRTSWTRADL